MLRTDRCVILPPVLSIDLETIPPDLLSCDFDISLPPQLLFSDQFALLEFRLEVEIQLNHANSLVIGIDRLDLRVDLDLIAEQKTAPVEAFRPNDDGAVASVVAQDSQVQRLIHFHQ